MQTNITTTTKSLCAKIPTELHERITTEKEQSNLTLNDYVTNLINEYYELKKGKKIMANENTRTLAIQISEELFERVKAHLKSTGQSQKAFLISIIEKAIEENENSAT